MSWLMATLLTVELTTGVPERAVYPSFSVPGPVEGPLSPAMAAYMSLAAPLALGVAGAHVTHDLAWTVAMASTGYAAGHVYAGEYGRGAAWSVGGAAAIALAGAYGHYLDHQAVSCGDATAPCMGSNTMPGFMLGAGLLATLLAASDAVATAERRNMELTGWRAPLAPPRPRDPWRF